jgi:hypothetical protein
LSIGSIFTRTLVVINSQRADTEGLEFALESL